MTKETKELLLANGTWMALGLVIGAILGGLFVICAFNAAGSLA